jgi:tetratricopeptide (TPR) repeat protein
MTRRTEGAELNDRGRFLLLQGRYAEAAEEHEEAAAFFRRSGHLGLALQGLRRFDDAVAAHERSAAIFEESGDQVPLAETRANLQSARDHQDPA